MPNAWPKTKVPVLLKVTALVTVPPVPVNDTLFTVLATVKDVAVRLPVKLVLPPIFCKAKVPEPLTLVPVTSAPLIALPVCNVRVKVLEPSDMAPKVMSPAVLVALVFKVVAAPKVTGPKTMAVLVLLIVPFKVLALGAVAVKPPV